VARWLTVVIVAESVRRHEELAHALEGLPVELVKPEDVLGATPHIEEAEGCEETAVRRAREICRMTGLVTLAEASGLEVDALGGRPGLRAGRFAHERATDAENNAALLTALEDIEDEARTAHFRCVLAAASPWQEDVFTTTGSVAGSIARTSAGSAGLGYEPPFLVARASGRVLADLTDDERRELAPHAQAIRALEPRFVALLNDLLDETERLTSR
jgi:XTP/dITP diphosphohydrolase